MNYLVRIDASPEIGLGHFMRCFALAQMLAERNNEVYFLINTKMQFVVDKIRNEKFSLNFLPENISLKMDSDFTAKYAKENNVNWIITDGYNFDSSYQKSIKNGGFKLLSIDDIPKFHFYSDIILNQNLLAEKNFSYSSENYTQKFLGIKYILYRKEFREISDYKRIINDDCKNILLTFGGSDPENITTRFINIFNNISDKKFNIKIILGPGFQFDDILENAISNSSHNIEVFKNVNDIISFYKWCDLAVTSAGSTVWELSKLKTPMIVGVVAENQEKIAEELRNVGLAVSLGWFKCMSDIAILEKVMEVILSKKIRENLKSKNNSSQFSSGIDELLLALS
jgi:UDP-2,4-diacetamido-2,4,6-trideoxy-beta-L-altropyranose hydrolase